MPNQENNKPGAPSPKGGFKKKRRHYGPPKANGAPKAPQAPSAPANPKPQATAPHPAQEKAPSAEGKKPLSGAARRRNRRNRRGPKPQQAPVTEPQVLTQEELPQEQEQPYSPCPSCEACPDCSTCSEPEEAPLPVDEGPQVIIVGVRFKEGGKIYYFDPGDYPLAKGDSVIVETSRGIECGQVAVANRPVRESSLTSPLKKLVRLATEQDLKKARSLREQEKLARRIWEEKLAGHKLDMTLVDVEYTFDGQKLIFYFTAEGRVDFRDFVKDLATVFKTRIELRQIGVRDEARQLGGLGVCGRPFCCKTFLDDFQQVSIKMAKEQNLSLNSVKISGTCGRLMCCLRYENDVYVQEAKKTPRVDSLVMTPDGQGVVCENNVLKGTCRVRLENKPELAPVTFHRDQLKVLGKAPRNAGKKPPEKEPEKND